MAKGPERMTNSISSKEELEKAFATIEQTQLRVDTIICSDCECTLNLKEKDSIPCEHLKKMFKDWADGNV